MSTVFKSANYAGLPPSGSVYTTIYTCPSLTTAIVVMVTVNASSNSPGGLGCLWLKGKSGGGTLALSTSIPSKLVLSAGDTLQARNITGSPGNNLDIDIGLIEIS